MNKSEGPGITTKGHRWACSKHMRLPLGGVFIPIRRGTPRYPGNTRVAKAVEFSPNSFQRRMADIAAALTGLREPLQRTRDGSTIICPSEPGCHLPTLAKTTLGDSISYIAQPPMSCLGTLNFLQVVVLSVRSR